MILRRHSFHPCRETATRPEDQIVLKQARAGKLQAHAEKLQTRANYRLVPESYKPRAETTSLYDRGRAALQGRDQQPKSAGLQPLWAYLLFTALCPARQPPPPYCKINSDGRESRRSFRVFQSGSPQFRVRFRRHSIHNIRCDEEADRAAQILKRSGDIQYGNRRQDRKDRRP